MSKDTRFKPGNTKGQKFSSDNQPENRGRKPNSVSQYLKKIGESQRVEFHVKITDANGKEQTKKGVIDVGKTLDVDANVNELLANLMWVDAIKGDKKTRREILDRVEGRPASFIDITSKGESVTLTEDDRTNLKAFLAAKLLKSAGNG